MTETNQFATFQSPDSRTEEVYTLADLYLRLQSAQPDKKDNDRFVLVSQPRDAPNSICGIQQHTCFAADRLTWLAEMRRLWFRETCKLDNAVPDLTAASSVSATDILRALSKDHKIS